MSHTGEFCALGTAVCWASGTNFFAAAGRRMGSVSLNRLRIVMAGLLLGLTLLVLHGSPWPHWASRPQIGWLALSGLLGFVFGDFYYFRSLVILGPGRAALLASTAPLFTAAIAWPVIHERPGPFALLGMAMTVGGVAWVLFASQHRAHDPVEGSVAMGVLAGVLGALGQASGYVVSKIALRSGLDPISATMIRVCVAAAAMWGWAIARGEAGRTLRALADPGAAALMAAGATFGPFLGVTLSLAALQYIEAGVAASITACYPVLAILISSRFHGERLTWRILLGALVAVAGVVVLFRR
ncbi:MAG TPA: DMT family transporter [Dongiaceae bacterium]|nr:DMT family transporter [Dongiaceae bacterium]